MIPSVWELALLALAVYRVWRLAGLDDAPWLERGRDRIVRADRRTLYMWLTCSWCAGTWLAGLVAACWFVDARWTLLAATPFALATLVGALGHVLNE